MQCCKSALFCQYFSHSFTYTWFGNITATCLFISHLLKISLNMTERTSTKYMFDSKHIRSNGPYLPTEAVARHWEGGTSPDLNFTSVLPQRASSQLLDCRELVSSHLRAYAVCPMTPCHAECISATLKLIFAFLFYHFLIRELQNYRYMKFVRVDDDRTYSIMTISCLVMTWLLIVLVCPDSIPEGLICTR